MSILIKRWYNIGAVVAVGAIAYLAFSWSALEVIQRLLIMSFIAILVHQFEEYGFPGGEPAIMNIALQNSDTPDRYPLNQFSAMLTNVLATYWFYLLPLFFPHIIWIGLAPMLFGFGQFAVHGIMTNIKMKSIYNPGLGAVVFLHFPIGIYYIWYVTINHIITGKDWLFAVVYMVAFMALIVNGLTYRLFPNKNTKWVFDKVEMERFHVKEKMAKLKK